MPLSEQIKLSISMYTAALGTVGLAIEAWKLTRPHATNIAPNNRYDHADFRNGASRIPP